MGPTPGVVNSVAASEEAAPAWDYAGHRAAELIERRAANLDAALLENWWWRAVEETRWLRSSFSPNEDIRFLQWLNEIANLF